MIDLCNFEPTQYTTAPQETEGWINFRASHEGWIVVSMKKDWKTVFGDE